MKTKLLPRIILGLAAIAAITAAPRASAVPITFSGGGGTPLSFTLSQPVTYTITASTAFNNPLFVFQNVFAVPPANSSGPVSGSITYSINGGPALSLFSLELGALGGSITTNDLYFFGTAAGFMVGDVVVLTGGTLTTSGNFAAMPASGNFNTFIAYGLNNARISTDGTTSVPESLATLWLALPVAAMFAARRFRIDAPGH